MYVGMNRILLMNVVIGGSVPHVRGDEPGVLVQGHLGHMRSPCTWG